MGPQMGSWPKLGLSVIFQRERKKRSGAGQGQLFQVISPISHRPKEWGQSLLLTLGTEEVKETSHSGKDMETSLLRGTGVTKPHPFSRLYFQDLCFSTYHATLKTYLTYFAEDKFLSLVRQGVIVNLHQQACAHACTHTHTHSVSKKDLKWVYHK